MRADPESVEAALAEVSAIGPYFAISTDPGLAGDGAWRPLGELSADTAALRARVEDFQRRLGTDESRVAASILFQGLAARLWSPIVAAAAARGLVPAAAPAEIRWRPAATGPLPLSASRTSHWLALPDPAPARPADTPSDADRADVTGTAAVVHRAVATELLEPLVDAVRGITKVSASLLWGNAASSLAGTLRTLPAARPDLGPRAARLVREVLGLGMLAGTGRLAEPAPGQYFFVRVSCCLYYRVPGGGMCDDCALIDPPVRDAQWARAARRARTGREPGGSGA
ncbi:(2Fe-2S)-binding protein [Sphaerisporangium dianthi]|uniref:(2Fe-2S)-binding protein n=1 Tax=Sphaerisporangium dianthi TaxID=1436120 RepID=A0ABV9CPM8_9ACTN